MLTVKIYSFSYLYTGIPEDNSGNGGGFVFDCRFINNPGKLTGLMPLTGKDKKVIKFLDETPEMQKFLTKCYDIIDSAVENYDGRKFTDLMVSFGCTGGRHRSVYAAEHLYEHLKNLYIDKIRISINHSSLS
jgi:RNase adaptor protein for sRNA GlmZ degradation